MPAAALADAAERDPEGGESKPWGLSYGLFELAGPATFAEMFFLLNRKSWGKLLLFLKT